MRINDFAWATLSHVPNLELLIVTYGGKLVFIVLVPAHILDDVGVCIIDLKDWVNSIRKLILAIDIP